MSNALVFNHHSLPFTSSQNADKAIPVFLKFCISASVSVGLKTILIDESIDNNWFRVELAHGYYLQDWFSKYKNDNSFREEIRVFRSIKTKFLFDAEDIGGELELFDIKEVSTGNSYSALRAAAWYESPLCSFPTSSLWETTPLKICIEMINNTCALVRKNEQIINIYSMAIWNSVKKELIKNRNEDIGTGATLWSQRKNIFSFLNFCGKTSVQLQHWNHGKNLFQETKKVLTILNTYAEKIKNGTYDGYNSRQLREAGLNHNVSGEPSNVRGNKKLRKEREFYLQDGSLAFFENHIKLSNGFRIHFYLEPQRGIINIGYIGCHLRLK